MSTTKKYGIEILDVGPHPRTGAMIAAYKCIDIEFDRTIASGIAPRGEIASLCQRQLELLAVTLGAKWAIAIEIVDDPKNAS